MDIVTVILFVVIAVVGVGLVVCIHDVSSVQPKIMASYASQYDVNDVAVFLDAIDADWHDFQDSVTLRKTYEEVRDGKQSLAEIKKKKNTTSYIPVVIPIR